MYAKFILVALLACFATSHALTKSLGETIECMSRASVPETRVGESQIRKAFEKLKEALKPYDPISVTDKRININNQLVNLDSNWTINAQGFSNIDLTQISLSLIGLRLKFTIKVPEIIANGQYSIDGSSSLTTQRVFGKGTFDVASRGFVLKGTGKISTRLSWGKMIVQIKRLEIDPSLEEFSLALTGLMNDEELSQKISTELSNNLPRLIQENKDRLNQVIKNILPYVNQFLEDNMYSVSSVKC